jgi:hypothetical protein
VAPVGKVVKSTRSGGSPDRGVASHATTSGESAGGGVGVGVVVGGGVPPGTVVTGTVGGGGRNSSRSGTPSVTSSPPVVTAAAAPAAITVPARPTPPKPAGRDGPTVAGPVVAKGAATLLQSPSRATTTGAYSDVRAEPAPCTST